MVSAGTLKEFHQFLKRVDRLTEGQAQVTNINWDDGDLEDFILVIRPNSGLYKGGIFEFQFQVRLPEDTDPKDVTPHVSCLTDIYHPNINTTEEEHSDLNVCFNLLEYQHFVSGFEALTMGLIFLLKHPNLESPLSPHFIVRGYVKPDTFRANVAKYMRGEAVDGHVFHTNFRIIDGVTVEQKINDINNSDTETRIDDSGTVSNSTTSTDVNCTCEQRHKSDDNAPGNVDGFDDSDTDAGEPEMFYDGTMCFLSYRERSERVCLGLVKRHSGVAINVSERRGSKPDNIFENKQRFYNLIRTIAMRCAKFGMIVIRCFILYGVISHKVSRISST